MEPEEFITICYATWVLLWKLGGFGFNGVSVFLEFRDGLWSVLDFENPLNFANWGLLFQPA